MSWPIGQGNLVSDTRKPDVQHPLLRPLSRPFLGAELGLGCVKRKYRAFRLENHSTGWRTVTRIRVRWVSNRQVRHVFSAACDPDGEFHSKRFSKNSVLKQPGSGLAFSVPSRACLLLYREAAARGAGGDGVICWTRSSSARSTAPATASGSQTVNPAPAAGEARECHYLPKRQHSFCTMNQLGSNMLQAPRRHLARAPVRQTL